MNIIHRCSELLSSIANFERSLRLLFQPGSPEKRRLADDFFAICADDPFSPGGFR
jgi:hypothetical protein